MTAHEGNAGVRASSTRDVAPITGRSIKTSHKTSEDSTRRHRLAANGLAK
jgi:hypothetical protein